MTPEEAVRIVAELADEDDTLMDDEQEALRVLLAERERLREALFDTQTADHLGICDSGYSAGWVARAALAGKARP